ncbi:uncharacterized protein LOC142534948 isoform X2 [Primulina tabacum]|uniref:uncharacterized protein LOC142534948 isoform X2 n=1 Tax=Primulina tabacum TaxID=48773 RepID=UPI003F5942F1
MSAYMHAPNALGLPVFGRENIFLHASTSRCGLSLRDFAFRGIVMAAASVASTITVMRPPSSMLQDLEKLLFKPDGYNYWMWPGRKIHYVVEGEGFPIVPIHGFGASTYQWRNKNDLNNNNLLCDLKVLNANGF